MIIFKKVSDTYYKYKKFFIVKYGDRWYFGQRNKNGKVEYKKDNYPHLEDWIRLLHDKTKQKIEVR